MLRPRGEVPRHVAPRGGLTDNEKTKQKNDQAPCVRVCVYVKAEEINRGRYISLLLPAGSVTRPSACFTNRVWSSGGFYKTTGEAVLHQKNVKK